MLGYTIPGQLPGSGVNNHREQNSKIKHPRFLWGAFILK